MEMEGRNGVFVVLRVDTSAAVADILHIGDPSKIETNIPLARLRVVRRAEPVKEAQRARV